MIELLFWIAFAIIFYIYLGYPLLIFILARVFTRPVQADSSYEPTVSLIISAFNEEAVIADKLANSLDLKYPGEKLKIWVVSDASTDQTDQIVSDYKDTQINLFRLDQRRGKTFGITSVMKQIDSEIIIFSDANAIYDQNAIRELVKYFADETVGYVVGHARYYKDGQSSAGSSEDTYWSFEVMLKMNESKIASVVGGDGAIYAIRRALFKPLKAYDINDFVNPIQIILQGYRGIFTDQAVCYEETAETFFKEYRRKRRIVNRSWRGLWSNASVLNPFKTGLYAFQIISHKLLRWLAGTFLLLLFVLNVFLAGRGWIYDATMIGQIALYALAALGYVLDKQSRNMIFPVTVPYYFVMVNLASLQGIFDAWRGETYTTWKTIRESK